MGLLDDPDSRSSPAQVSKGVRLMRQLLTGLVQCRLALSSEVGADAAHVPDQWD